MKAEDIVNITHHAGREGKSVKIKYLKWLVFPVQTTVKASDVKASINEDYVSALHKKIPLHNIKEVTII